VKILDVVIDEIAEWSALLVKTAFSAAHFLARKLDSWQGFHVPAM
jgi:hypothetical protein